MKSIKEVEAFVNECIRKADDCLPVESAYYYRAGLYAVLDFLKGENKE